MTPYFSVSFTINNYFITDNISFPLNVTYLTPNRNSLVLHTRHQKLLNFRSLLKLLKLLLLYELELSFFKYMPIVKKENTLHNSVTFAYKYVQNHKNTAATDILKVKETC